MSDLIDYARILRHARSHLQYTLAQMAEACGVSETKYAQMEKGDVIPSPLELLSLAEATTFRTDFLFGLIPLPRLREMNKDEYTPDEIEFLMSVRDWQKKADLSERQAVKIMEQLFAFLREDAKQYIAKAPRTAERLVAQVEIVLGSTLNTAQHTALVERATQELLDAHKNGLHERIGG
jgi:transcriptional regulator with XRE-family HTH domain